MKQGRRRVVLGALGLSLAPGMALAPGLAFAGAWTEPQGQGQAIATLYGWMGAGAPYGGPSSPRETKVGEQT